MRAMFLLGWFLAAWGAYDFGLLLQARQDRAVSQPADNGQVQAQDGTNTYPPP